MNSKLEQRLITVLLDKYERSSFFRTGTSQTKRIMIKLYDNGKSELPEYDIENSEQRISANECVQELTQKGLVCFEWMKGEEKHIISKVWLNMDNLQDIYCYVHRQPQSVFLSNVENELSNSMRSIRLRWINEFLQDALAYIQKNRKLHTLVPKDEQERKSLLQALMYLDNNQDNELLKRVFSIRCFGDSKYFERIVENHLLRILKKYLACDEQLSDEQLLNQIGIVKYPEQFEFCGSISFVFTNNITVDFSSLSNGSVVYGHDIATSTIVPSKELHHIITIENKANYFDYISKQRKPNELVIYHGGQYSPSKRIFLHAVADASEQIPWYHWGDIDYGGFSMLARLRREIKPSIQSYRMNIQELITFSAFATSFSSEYSQKLLELASKSELKDCAECLAYMQEHRVRLEQEALLG